MMRHLLFLSLSLLLTATSCAPSVLKGLHREEKVWVDRKQLPPMLNASAGVCRLTMTVDMRKNHFSGLLFVKQTGEDRYRLLFSAHFGLSLFDIEITPGAIEVHHCPEALNRGRVIDLLHHDFSILLGLNLKGENPAIRYASPSSPADTVYRLTKSPAKGYYRQDHTTGQLTEIRTGSGFRKAAFQKDADRNTILITHPFIGLSFSLAP